MANIPKQLLGILQELQTEELKLFQWHLTSGVKDFKHIPKALLEKDDRCVTVDKMVQTYGSVGAVEIMLATLKEMNQNQLAEELRARTREVVDISGENSKDVFTSTPTDVMKKPAVHICRSDTMKTHKEQQERIKLMTTLTHTYERVLIGSSLRGHKKFLDDIYTDLIIVENESGGVIHEHEVMQIEMSHIKPGGEETYVKCSDIFKVQSDKSRRYRKVLTMGIAGVGKTVSVNKFILDWAKQRENQDIHFVFSLPFRELNLKKKQKFSLMELLNQCFFSSTTSLKTLPEEDGKVLFIFDGLDECCFSLCFENCEELKDVNQKASLGTLITNLVNGNLLPFALIWITCRPAAAHLIPRDYTDLVTEVQGFNDEQKEMYFNKYCNHNQELKMKMISHIKKSRTLHTMCQIPVFCWISATVLKSLMGLENSKEIPSTLTGMYTNFLLQQKNLMKRKYSEEAISRDDTERIILKLGKLAFQNLEHGTLIFYEENLKKCDIDVRDGVVFSGVCTQIFNPQEGISEKNIFSFVHLSIQESLAALYVHHSHCKKKLNAFKQGTFWNKLTWRNKELGDIHRYAIKRALQNENGQMDLFLRFLLGFSLKANQSELKELLPSLKITEWSVRNTTDYIKEKLKEVSDEIHKKFELRKYRPSHEGLTRLLSVVKNTRQAILDCCYLSKESCELLASVFKSHSVLRVLDLSNNDVQDSGVELLSAGLMSLHCKLEILRLSGCMVTEKGCSSLASALSSNPSNLKELDLTYNHPGDSGVKLLSARLEDPQFKLEILKMEHAGKNRIKQGLKKYGCELTLDPEAAHVLVEEGNRKVTWVKKQSSHSCDPERYDYWSEQFLCRDSLSGRCYWEAEWSGAGIAIGVAYKGITQQRDSGDCVFGWNEKSWSVICTNNGYSAWHNKKRIEIPASTFHSNRAGVYLDWQAGTLSFYNISSERHTLTHIHTFHSTFTEALYAGFRIWTSNSSIYVCQI
ncbi:NACHT, LRR and PYD domains-containing protein 12-like isoform X1 [Brachyhypopomus gauderio]|uniref:NACHT, LRR and PYD domains-containing protein 12-like isoform X1 n=1 Tax=Brachyhypopomus gauderio TaxID=698409 RepID=UPI00404127DB